MKYKSVIVTKRGSPEVLKIVENDLREPFVKEARTMFVRIRYTLCYLIAGTRTYSERCWVARIADISPEVVLCIYIYYSFTPDTMSYILEYVVVCDYCSDNSSIYTLVMGL